MHVGKKNEAQKADPSHHIGGFHPPKHLKTSQNTSEHQLEEPHKARARLVSCSSATWQARPS